MKKILLIATLIMAVGLVFAFHGNMDGKSEKGPRMEKDGAFMMKMMAEELELTDAQMDKIEEIQLAHKKEMIEKRAELQKLQLDKKAAIKVEDSAKAKKINAKIFDLKKEMADARIDVKDDVMNQLTEEQKAKAKELRKKAGKKMMHRKHGEGHGEGRGEGCGEKGEGRHGMHEHRSCGGCEDAE